MPNGVLGLNLQQYESRINFDDPDKTIANCLLCAEGPLGEKWHHCLEHGPRDPYKPFKRLTILVIPILPVS